ncbi:response regulator [Kocuria rosea]|uniref:Transcriptional regulatory protein n=1 Tax=Kocuria rosea TaxID=1275 RepID=A0A4V6PNA9_KOCRO|nr:response regulator [Kocuria rosea]TDL37748.1 response regulator [Kocuria rosea]
MSAPLRVLVVDDEPLTAAAHAQYVERSPGFEAAATAVSGRTAVQAVQAARRAGRPVDLVLLDVNLPDMSGLDVARTLRARGETVDLLVITAHRDVATVRAASTLGVVGYLIKPFTYAVFEEKLDAYRRYRSALGAAGTVGQAEVDRAFAALGAPTRPDAPKGLSPQTLESVTALIRGGEWLSAGEAAERSTLSRVTARRYLEHLTARGLVQRRPRHGTPGRPELEYGWAGQDVSPGR